MGTVRTKKEEKMLNGRIETIPFINPANNEQFGEVPMATQQQVADARREMEAASKIWAVKPVKERVRLLRQLQKLIIDQADEITAVMNKDNGKSRQDALTEVFVTVDLMNQYLKHAPHWLRRRRVSSGLQFFKRCYVEPKPHGVVSVIGPWNFPFVLMLPPIMSALLAGNTVLAKPSEVTGATGVLLEELFSQVPELAPFVRFLHGNGRVGAGIVASNPDLIYLTGSVETGKKIMQAAAENLTPVIFELGSKDPMIVLEDADIESAAKWGVWGAFFNTGQACISVERVYVVEPVYDQFVQAVLAETEKVKVGYSPAIDNPLDVGPITFQRQFDIIDDHMQDALDKGAQVAIGGQKDGMFMEPTVVLNVDHGMKLMREETFGPIMPIMKVESEAHAIQLANDSDMGLGASVWSQDIKRAERVAHQIETGSVNINDTITHFVIPNLPFGGVKQSGNGRAHGEEDLLQFTNSHAYAVGNSPSPYDIATILRTPGTYETNKAIMKVAFGVTPQQRLEPVQEFVEKQPLVAKVGMLTAVLGVLGLITAVTLKLVRLNNE